MQATLFFSVKKKKSQIKKKGSKMIDGKRSLLLVKNSIKFLESFRTKIFRQSPSIVGDIKL